MSEILTPAEMASLTAALAPARVSVQRFSYGRDLGVQVELPWPASPRRRAARVEDWALIRPEQRAATLAGIVTSLAEWVARHDPKTP